MKSRFQVSRCCCRRAKTGNYTVSRYLSFTDGGGPGWSLTGVGVDFAKDYSGTTDLAFVLSPNLTGGFGIPGTATSIVYTIDFRDTTSSPPFGLTPHNGSYRMRGVMRTISGGLVTPIYESSILGPSVVFNENTAPNAANVDVDVTSIYQWFDTNQGYDESIHYIDLLFEIDPAASSVSRGIAALTGSLSYVD